MKCESGRAIDTKGARPLGLFRGMQLQTTGSNSAHHVYAMWTPVFVANLGNRKRVRIARKQVF